MDKLGYYNASRKEMILTEERLKEFEQDINNGKELDIKKYLDNNTNYRNTYSDIGYYSSNVIDNIFNSGMKKVGKLLKKLFG